MTPTASVVRFNWWTAGFAALGAASVLALFALLADPVSALVGGAVLAIPALALYCAAAPRAWIFVILISKPIVDLAWRWKFLQVGGQGVNIQTVVALLVIVLTALAVLARARHRLIFPPVAIFAVCAALSVLMNPTIGSLNELLRHYAGLGFFVVAPIALRDDHDLDLFAKWMLVTVSVPVGLSFLQLAGILPFEYWDDTEFGHLSRVSGTYQHPLGLIYFLVVAVPLALLLIYRNRRRFWLQGLCWLFIAASLVALAFTYHRTGIVTVAAEILLWFLLTRQFGKAALVFLAGAVAVAATADWVGMLYRDVGVGGQIGADTLRGRGANWYAFGWSYLQGHPLNWLLGFGESQATAEVPGVGLFTTDEAHTDFLRILYIYGLAGLGLYVGILGTFLHRAIRLYRSREESLRTFGALAILVFFAVCLLSITSEPTRYPTSAWYFFVIGAAVVVKDRERRSPARVRLQCALHGLRDVSTNA